MDLNSQLKEWIDEFEQLYPKRKILFLYKAGSHFFDLNTTVSDSDYRGVYLPGLNEFPGENRRKQHERKTNVGKHIKNSKDDVDLLLFSFTKVLELLKSGDFNVMELLYTPESKILVDSPLMKELRGFRSNLITNDVSAFLGFIKKEYVRYGVNIDHYGVQLKLLNFLEAMKLEVGGETKLKQIWEELKNYAKTENLITFTQNLVGKNKLPAIKIAQRMYQWTIKIDYLIDAINYRIKTYGHRQQKMAKDGKEYKGLMHALRLIYEAQDIFNTGEMIMPFCKERHDILMSIKLGSMEQKKIHTLIDDGIDDIIMKEASTPSNKKSVCDRIDRIIFTYRSRMNLERILRRKDD